MPPKSNPSHPSPTPAQITKRTTHIRKLFHRSGFEPILPRQRASTRDVPAKAHEWVSKVHYSPPPEGGLRQVLCDAVQELGMGMDVGGVQVPEIGGLDAEWVGWRGGGGEDDEREGMGEKERYEGMMREVKSEMVVLFGYGGAFMLGSPSTARPLASKLAHLTKARVYIPKYRLAPQNPFPAALLDILHAYLTLLSPPPGSLHAPVSPQSILFAGESSGANLVLAALQVLLSFSRKSSSQGLEPTIPFHGKQVTLGIPAGTALLSLVADNVLATPSWITHAESDIFDDESPAITPGFPSDASWPSTPPRGHIYTEPRMLMHPLVSPCTTPPHLWAGAPPVWVAMGGGERLLDAAKMVVRDVLGAGGRVRWVEVERMPHLFTGFGDWWQVGRVVGLWAGACGEMVRGGEFVSEGLVLCVDQREKEVDVRRLTELRREDVLLAMRKKVEGMKVWTGEYGAKERGKL